MGKIFFALVIGGIVFAIGLSFFPTIKNILGFNSTTGYSYLLSAAYGGLKYALAFFIFFAVWLALNRRK
jgi:H+/Cl- antiporter ClcA